MALIWILAIDYKTGKKIPVQIDSRQKHRLTNCKHYQTKKEALNEIKNGK